MKKYSIYSLYVVEVQNGNDTHYLICKHNELSNTYVEILTNEKVKVANNSSVEPLSNYYSVLAQCNYITGKPLMLDKKEILRKYITINGEASLEKGEALFQSGNNTIEANGILEKATLNFFPKEGIWYSHCFRQPQDLSMANLPCHLRDDLWLAKMLKQNQKLFYMSTNKVLQFVKTSKFFKEKRHEYEQEIVKWQIDWMRSGGENWVIDEDYGGDFVFLTSVCDLGFRKGVVDTLSSIGMNIDAIEEGIERNADRWRDSFMNRAFANEYNPVFLNIDFSNFFGENEQQKEERKTLEPADQEFKEKWLQMRKYEYYQRHKNSVDKYGVVEPDMTLSENEVAELREYLEQKHNERKAQIEQYEQERNASKGQQRVLRKDINN
ncbi:MAG: hypothetical protein SPJ74_05980 [Bacilli bacterium]|nr:hypothetical protein [Bacilli bacterium]